MVRVLHVFQFWWWSCKFPWALGYRMFYLITFCLVLILQPQFPAGLKRIVLSMRLRMSDFWIFESGSTSFLDAISTSFFHRHTPDWPEIPNFVKRFPNSFARARAIPDMDLLSPLESLHSKSSSGLFSTWRFSFPVGMFGLNFVVGWM